MKRAALYARVSTPDQHVENQFLDLRKLAAQRGFEVSREYCDRGVSGSKSRRPGLDAMMADACRGEFSVLMVAAFDRIARSTKNFLEIVDELHELGIEFVSAREASRTPPPTGVAAGQPAKSRVQNTGRTHRRFRVSRLESRF